MAGTVVAAEVPLLAEAGFSSDADGFRMQRLGAGGAFRYNHFLDYSGVSVLHTRYAQHGWSANGQRLQFTHSDRAPNGEGMEATIGAAAVGGHQTGVGEVTFNRRLGSATGFELVAARDWVDTRAAIETGLTSTFVAASVERDITERLTGILLAGRQHFSDGNDRDHLRGRLIFGLAPEHGLTLQLRHRRYEADDINVPRRYFNPRHYEESMLGLAVRRRLGTDAGRWLLGASANVGRERIDHSVNNATSLFEIRAEGPLKGGVHLRLSASHQRASGFDSGAGYWFSQMGIALIVPLR